MFAVLYAAAVCCAGSGLAPPALAQQLDPLLLRNPSVLTRLYGLPVVLPARLLAPEQSLWQAGVTLANTFSRDADSREAVFLDGELTELKLLWRGGASIGEQQLEFSAMLDAVHHGGGVLDHGIEQFHSSFGLPQGNRKRFDNDGLRYAYRDGDALLLEFEQGGSALGDLQLGTALRLFEDAQRVATARLTLKLPTGDADRLGGSGAADVALALHAGAALWGGQLDAAGGAVLLGDGDVLADKQRDAAAFGHVAYVYPWSSAVALLVQLGGNSGVYADTAMTGLEDSAFMALGTRWRVHRHWSLEAALTEDILVNSVPDVAFSLGLRYQPP